MIIGTLIGAMFGMGVLASVAAVRSARPTLLSRVAPYVGTPPEPSVTYSARALFGPGLQRAGETLGRIVGGSTGVERRLDRLGWSMTVSEFRARQVVAGGVGLGIAFAVGLWLASVSTPAPLALVLLCLAGGLGGIVAYDVALGRRLSTLEARQAEQFPTVAELMSLAVASGESPNRALERIVTSTHGELAGALRRVVAEINAGMPFVDAFDALAARTGVPVIARFAEALAVAVERGTPLTDVLHAQAGDVRESARRDLIESAARREILMMIPVVFILMPTTVIVAFYPGFIGLSLGSG